MRSKNLFSVIRYFLIISGNVVKLDFDGLVRLRKRAVRLLTRCPRLLHTDPIFQQKGFLKINSILKFEMCKFIHRILYHMSIFELTPRFGLHSCNTDFNFDIIWTSIRTNVAAKFILYEVVNFYKSLPYEFKCVSSYKNSSKQ